MPKKGKPRRILTPEQISEVRALKGTVAQYDLAKRFGVKPGCIEYWQSHDKPPVALTREEVQAIRDMGSQRSVAEISEQFKTSRDAIRRVLSGASFKDVA